MITVIAALLSKIAMTAVVTLLVMLLIDGFYRHEDPEKGIVKEKVPAFVPIVGGASVIAIVVSVVAIIMIAIWV